MTKALLYKLIFAPFKLLNFLIHQFFGTTLMIPIVILSITGVVLNIAEFSNNFSSSIKKPKFEDYNKLELSIKNYVNEGEILFFKLPIKENAESIRVRYRGKDGVKHLQVNQNYEVTPEKTNEFLKFVLKIHDNRFFTNGRKFVGYVGLALLALCVTGFILYFLQKNLSYKKGLKPKHTIAFYKNFHAFFGLVIGGFLVVNTFSGVSLAFPKEARAFLEFILPSAKKPQETLEFLQKPSLQEKVKFAEEKFPGGLVEYIFFPTKQNNFHTSVNVILNQKLPIILKFNKEGVLTEIANPANYSLAETVFLWQGNLHKGRFGMIWWVLQLITGVYLCLLSLSGFLLWYKKGKLRQENTLKKRAVAQI